MNETTVEHLDSAQRRALSMLGALARSAQPGLELRDLMVAAGALLVPHGFERWAERPVVRIGGESAWKPAAACARLTAGCTLTLRLQPAVGPLRAHVGATVVVGAPETAIVTAARDCTRALCGYASGLKCVGELFIYARTWALTHDLQLLDRRSIGHALPVTPDPAEGLAGRLRSAGWLRRNQIHILNPRRLTGPWVIGPTLAGGDTSAAFIEVILVQPGLRRILGRNGLEQVGTLPG